MDIVQLAPGSPADQGQWWLAACQEDDVQRGGQMIDKKGQHVVDTRLCDDVIVVENEQCAADMVRDVIEQKRQHQFLRRQLKEWLKRGEEQSKGAASEIGVKALTGRDDRAPEPRRIVISFIQCHPGDVLVENSGGVGRSFSRQLRHSRDMVCSALGQPLVDRCRFAKACWRPEQGEFVRHPRIEPGYDVWTCNQGRWKMWR